MGKAEFAPAIRCPLSSTTDATVGAGKYFPTLWARISYGEVEVSGFGVLMRFFEKGWSGGAISGQRLERLKLWRMHTRSVVRL